MSLKFELIHLKKKPQTNVEKRYAIKKKIQ